MINVTITDNLVVGLKSQSQNTDEVNTQAILDLTENGTF